MENSKDPKKKIKTDGFSATTICFLVAALVIVVGYIILTQFREYTFLDFVDSVVGNLIGVFGGFCVFDILYNKLTLEAQTRETSQQIAKTLMGEPDVMDAFDDKDKRMFLKSTIASMLKDEDVVEMVTTNVDKYIDKSYTSRIRKSFDYIIHLEPELTPEYAAFHFPGGREKYYLIDEEFRFTMKYLAPEVNGLKSNRVSIGFAYDKNSLDDGLLETGNDEEFCKCIFNEDLIVGPEVVDFINQIPKEKLTEVIDALFMPILRIDNSSNEENNLVQVKRKEHGIILEFEIDFDHRETVCEHAVSIYFKMPRLWNTYFEVTLVDPTRAPHIKLKYKPADMDVTMYSYLNKDTQTNVGACIERAGLYDIAIREEWVYPKSGVVFSIKKKQEDIK